MCISHSCPFSYCLCDLSPSVCLFILPSAYPSCRLLVHLSRLSCLPACLSACLLHSVTHLAWECIRLNDLVWTATTPRSIELRARRDLSLHRHRNVTAHSKILLYVRVAPIFHMILQLSELNQVRYLKNLVLNYKTKMVTDFGLHKKINQGC
jgi:hypothetical protein